MEKRGIPKPGFLANKAVLTGNKGVLAGNKGVLAAKNPVKSATATATVASTSNERAVLKSTQPTKLQATSSTQASVGKPNLKVQPTIQTRKLARRSKSAIDLRPKATVTSGSAFNTLSKWGRKRPSPIPEDKENTKPKVAKPAPYDYKARFNLLNEKHQKLVEAHKELKQTLGNYADYDILKTNIGEIELELTNTKEAYASMQNENDLLKKDLNLWTQKAEKLKVDLARSERERGEFQNTCEIYKKQLGDVEANYQNALKQIKALKDENSFLQNDLARSERERDKFQNECEIYKKQLNDLEANYQNALKQIKALKDENSFLQNEICSSNQLRRKLHNDIHDLKGNVRVFCRIRPPMHSEEDRLSCNFNLINDSTFEIKKSKESILTISGKLTDMKNEFSFDKVFGPLTTQEEVFEELSNFVQSALDGYHVCVFAYGQTGSGKTYTMLGEDAEDEQGVIPRTVHMVFSAIKNLEMLGWKYLVEVSFMEIYNEAINDLLNPNSGLQYDIRYNEGKGIIVTNLVIETVTSAHEMEQLMVAAQRNRAVAVTNFNEHSSRSHAITKITLRGHHKGRSILCSGSINLVDLAGSESAKTSERIEETKCINKSLSALGTVILALNNKDSHIPYRNSKLTYLLQSSLGGDSKTLMFVNISPLEDCFNESLNSLKFAARVKEVKTNSKQNKVKAPQQSSSLASLVKW